MDGPAAKVPGVWQQAGGAAADGLRWRGLCQRGKRSASGAALSQLQVPLPLAIDTKVTEATVQVLLANHPSSSVTGPEHLYLNVPEDCCCGHLQLLLQAFAGWGSPGTGGFACCHDGCCARPRF
jgi:hypothetical protein